MDIEVASNFAALAANDKTSVGEANSKSWPFIEDAPAFVVEIMQVRAELGFSKARNDVERADCTITDTCDTADELDLDYWLAVKFPDATARRMVGQEIKEMLMALFELAEATASDPGMALLLNTPTRASAPAAAPKSATPLKTSGPRVQTPTDSLFQLPPLKWIAAALLILSLPAIAFLVYRRRTADAVHEHIGYFFRRAYVAHEQYGHDNKHINSQVLEAFDTLSEQLRTLLAAGKLRINDLRREIDKFHSATPTARAHADVRSLRNIGYALAATEHFVDNAPFLAIYKLLSEARNRNGNVVNTYTIMKEGGASEFSNTFAAKIQSTVPIVLVAAVNTPQGSTIAARAAEPAATPPAVAVDKLASPAAPPADAPDTEHKVAYVMSLLGPHVPRDTHCLTHNLDAMASLPEDLAGGKLLSPLALRAQLHDLWSEDLSRRSTDLQRSRLALRLAPQLALLSLADWVREHAVPDAQWLPLLGRIAREQVGAATAELDARLSLMTRFMICLQSASVVEPNSVITNPGFAYVEARGAEADAGLLRRMAQLVVPPTRQGTQLHYNLMLTSALTPSVLRMELNEYAALQPSEAHHAVITSLLEQLQTSQFHVHVARNNQAQDISKLLAARSMKNRPVLVLCADPALVILTAIPAGLRYMLWTPGGHTLLPAPEQVAELMACAHALRTGLQPRQKPL